jgi:hypothetical protein
MIRASLWRKISPFHLNRTDIPFGPFILCTYICVLGNLSM